MQAVIAALAPIFMLIAIGWALRRIRLADDAFWAGLERFMYFFLMPALIVKELSNARLGQYEPLQLIAAMLAALIAMSAIVLALRPLLRVDGPAFTSIFQGAVRFNTFVGLGAAQALYQSEGVALFAVAMATLIPALNVVCVSVLVRYAGTSPGSIGEQLRQILRNPLIVACAVGIAFNLLGLRITGAVGVAADLLGKSAVAMGLLTVGAALDIASLHRVRWPLLIVIVGKLLVFPLVMAASCQVFGIDGLARTIVILWATLPTAPAAYILARQLGGDASLMAAGVTATTLAAALSMPPLLDWLI